MRTFRPVIVWGIIFLTISIGLLLIFVSQLESESSTENLENELISSDWVDEPQNSSVKEARSIKEFRLLTTNLTFPQAYMKDDTYIIRWIRDQDGNTKSAVEKFKKNLEWRHENHVEKILEENFSDLQVLCPFKFDGFDKKGNPIAYIPFGSWQLDKALIKGNIDRLYRMDYFMMENHTKIVQELSNHSGKLHKMLAIVDFSGFGYRNHACFQLPRSANALINLILPFVSKSTNEIVQIYGYDKSEWGFELLKYIDSDQLPIKYRINVTNQSAETETSSWWW